MSVFKLDSLKNLLTQRHRCGFASDLEYTLKTYGTTDLNVSDLRAQIAYAIKSAFDNAPYNDREHAFIQAVAGLVLDEIIKQNT